jgi:(p)ppGpp synthase/HD superfamily hydrolase
MTYKKEMISIHKELVYLKGFAKKGQYWEMLKAIQVAIELHEGQQRKAGGDYVEHPMSVTSELVALKLHNETLLSAALLHDVIEDCNTTRSELIMEYGFSTEVAAIVSLLSKTRELPTQEYYNRISKNPFATLIKVSDRCHNISTMIDAFSLDKMKEYVKETDEYVLPLCKYSINHYPLYSDELVVMRNHIESVVNCVKGFIRIIEK